MARVSCGVLCPVLVLLDGCIASGPNGLRVVRRPSCATLADDPGPRVSPGTHPADVSGYGRVLPRHHRLRATPEAPITVRWVNRRLQFLRTCAPAPQTSCPSVEPTPE